MATTAKPKTETVTAQKKTDPAMTEKVKIRLPKDRINKQTHLTVGLNGRMYQIQRGVDVEVPRAVAEIIEHSVRMEDQADEFIGLNRI